MGDDGRRQTTDDLAPWAFLWYSYGAPFRFEARCRMAQRSAAGDRREILGDDAILDRGLTTKDPSPEDDEDACPDACSSFTFTLAPEGSHD